MNYYVTAVAKDANGVILRVRVGAQISGENSIIVSVRDAVKRILDNREDWYTARHNVRGQWIEVKTNPHAKNGNDDYLQSKSNGIHEDNLNEMPRIG